MKIEYELSLYIEMARFQINDVVQVSNRKGRKSTIHVTNVTALTWHQLQLLVSEGADKFTKMVLLYREYSTKEKISKSIVNGKHLSSEEVQEIDQYVRLFRKHGCTEHHQVNEIISQKSAWDQFKTIRSLNDHGKYKQIKGVQPKYFEIVCGILEISGGYGYPLDRYEIY